MKNLDSRVISKWIELDKNTKTFYENLIFNACCKNKQTELIIWMVEAGFKTNSDDTIHLAKHNNLELLKYYYQKNLGINNSTFASAVLSGNLAILKWLFDNILFCGNSKLLEHAISKNNIEILEYLQSKGLTLEKSYYFKYFFYFKNKEVKNTTLLWLWNNGYKWTAKDAEKCCNTFMKDFFE
jgi:hypothetical protein